MVQEGSSDVLRWEWYIQSILRHAKPVCVHLPLAIWQDS